jgi:hypothetical protein
LTVFGVYTHFFFSQVENTLGIAGILRLFFYQSVENFLPCLWKKLWKTLQAILSLYLNIFMISKMEITACAKLQKMPRKKFFYVKKKCN